MLFQVENEHKWNRQIWSILEISINLIKTQYVFKVDNNSLNVVDRYKYLGIILNDFLEFKVTVSTLAIVILYIYKGTYFYNLITKIAILWTAIYVHLTSPNFISTIVQHIYTLNIINSLLSLICSVC